MPKVCCVPSCRLRSDDLEGLKKTFHTFPAEKCSRDKWEEILKTKFVNLSLGKYAYVCSSHFETECFYFSGLCKNVRLKKGSCPSIFYSSVEQNLLNEQVVEPENTKSCIEIDVLSNQKEDICMSETLNNQLKESQVESNGESNTDTFIHVAEFPKADLPAENSVVENNSQNESLTSKTRIKSLINIDIESLEAPKNLKVILQNAKAQMINLRRRNKNLEMKLYRWKKGVKSADSLLSYIKHRKYIGERVVDLLKINSKKV